LGKAIEAQGLVDVGFTASGCLGFCNAGPLMVVYPEGVWYQPRTAQDIDEIVEQHFKQGKRVDRLAVVLTRR
jgi:(2Fe-2S) ferredoxin